MKKFHLNEIEFISGTFNEALSFFVDRDLNCSAPLIVVHVNIYNYYLLCKMDNLFLSELKNKCEIIFDGIGLKLSLFLNGYGFLPDLNGTDLFPLVMKHFETKYRMYFLASKNDVIELAVENIRKQYPLLAIAGYRNGYFTIEEEDNVVDEIIRSDAEVLLIGRGFPLQEEFCLRNFERLRNLKIIWNVGGLFDFLSLKKPRAPFLLRLFRLEWLYRLILEPQRLWYRNTIAVLGAFANITKGRFQKAG